MALEIRPALPEEMEEFRRVAATALVMTPSVFGFMRPEWTLCAVADGKISTTLGALPLTMRLNGEGVPVSGVTSVGSLPVCRRRGYLRTVMARHFRNLHEQGERPIAALWASWAAIYQRFGYGIVSTRLSYAVEPRYIQFASAWQSPGCLREAGETETEAFVGMYKQFVEERTGYLERARGMWEYGVFAGAPAGGMLSRVVYEEDGVPQGYVVYATYPQPADPIPNHRLAIRDMVWLKPDAYRALWEHLGTMDLIHDIDWQRAPADDPLMHLLLEPRRLKATAYDGILARVVDVEKALTQRKYGAEGVLIFEVVDDLCPWNTGRWKLALSPDGSKVTHGRQFPQLTLPMSTLALLMFGQVSATEAARMGRLDVHDEAALPLWDQAMRTMHRPACPDMF